MPLYLEPENLRGTYPDEIVDAFVAIKAEIGAAAITPRIALNLIRKYFLPFDEVGIGEALGIRKQVDWNTVEFVGVYLIGEGYSCGKESALAFAIHDLFNYCRSPKRKPGRLSSDHVFSHCKLCWRHPVFYRNYCSLHHPDFNNSNYRYALRKKAVYDKVYHQITQSEAEEVGITNSTYKTFFPCDNQKAWLKDVRPNVWKLVSKRIGDCPDSDFLQLLLRELDYIPGETEAQQLRRSKLHEELLIAPHLISWMLTIAEAWLLVEQQRSETRGGKRENSGRKKQNSNLSD